MVYGMFSLVIVFIRSINNISVDLICKAETETQTWRRMWETEKEMVGWHP